MSKSLPKKYDQFANWLFTEPKYWKSLKIRRAYVVFYPITAPLRLLLMVTLLLCLPFAATWQLMFGSLGEIWGEDPAPKKKKEMDDGVA